MGTNLAALTATLAATLAAGATLVATSAALSIAGATLAATTLALSTTVSTSLVIDSGKNFLKSADMSNFARNSTKGLKALVATKNPPENNDKEFSNPSLLRNILKCSVTLSSSTPKYCLMFAIVLSSSLAKSFSALVAGSIPPLP